MAHMYKYMYQTVRLCACAFWPADRPADQLADRPSRFSRAPFLGSVSPKQRGHPQSHQPNKPTNLHGHEFSKNWRALWWTSFGQGSTFQRGLSYVQVSWPYKLRACGGGCICGLVLHEQSTQHPHHVQNPANPTWPSLGRVNNLNPNLGPFFPLKHHPQGHARRIAQHCHFETTGKMAIELDVSQNGTHGTPLDTNPPQFIHTGGEMWGIRPPLEGPKPPPY